MGNGPSSAGFLMELKKSQRDTNASLGSRVMLQPGEALTESGSIAYGTYMGTKEPMETRLGDIVFVVGSLVFAKDLDL